MHNVYELDNAWVLPKAIDYCQRGPYMDFLKLIKQRQQKGKKKFIPL